MTGLIDSVDEQEHITCKDGSTYVVRGVEWVESGQFIIVGSSVTIAIQPAYAVAVERVQPPFDVEGATRDLSDAISDWLSKNTGWDLRTCFSWNVRFKQIRGGVVSLGEDLLKE